MGLFRLIPDPCNTVNRAENTGYKLKAYGELISDVAIEIMANEFSAQGDGPNSCTQKPTTQRIAWLDIGRGASILLVVLYHTTYYSDLLGSELANLELINNVLGAVRMPFFFAISGLLSHSLISRKEPDLIVRRILKLSYLFLLWSFFSTLYYDFILWGDERNHFNFDNISTFFVEYFSSIITPRSSIWFIWALIFYMAISRLLRHKKIMASILGVIFLILSTSYFDNLHWSHVYFLHYFLAFYFGAFLDRKYISVLQNGNYLFILGVLGFALFGVVSSQFDEPSFGYTLARLGMSFCGVMVAIKACMFLSALKFFSSFSNLLSYLGRNTLQIYVLHDFFIWPVSKVINKMPFLHESSLAGFLPFLMVLLIVPVTLMIKAATDYLGLYWLFTPPRLIGRYGL